MTTVSHAASPMLKANSTGALDRAGSTSQIIRCGLRRPDAQISFLAPSSAVNGLSLGIRYRPFSLTVLVAVCSRRSGTMRRILPTRVSSRCGFSRRLSRCSPVPASPDPMYMTRQSRSPRRATGLKVISPIGWMASGCCRRISSRAVPSNVAFAVFRSFHSISTASRSIRPPTVGVGIVGVVV